MLKTLSFLLVAIFFNQNILAGEGNYTYKFPGCDGTYPAKEYSLEQRFCKDQTAVVVTIDGSRCNGWVKVELLCDNNKIVDVKTYDCFCD